MVFTIIRMILDIFLKEYIHFSTCMVHDDIVQYREVAHFNNGGIDKWITTKPGSKVVSYIPSYSNGVLDSVSKDGNQILISNQVFNCKNDLIKQKFIYNDTQYINFNIYRGYHGHIDKIYYTSRRKGSNNTDTAITFTFEYKNNIISCIHMYGNGDDVIPVDMSDNNCITIGTRDDQKISLVKSRDFLIEGHMQNGPETTYFRYLKCTDSKFIKDIQRTSYIIRHNKYFKSVIKG